MVAGAVPAFVVAVAFLPAQLVYDKPVAVAGDGEATQDVGTPYAIVPASANPVDDRISFGELEGVARLDEDREGDILFVTVSEPPQSLLSAWVGWGRGDYTPLTHAERYPGGTTPSQQRTVSLQMMRTSEQVAQYVALRAVGYEEARLVLGEVVVESVLCLQADGQTCTRMAPAAEVLRPGDTIKTVDGAEIGTVEDLQATLDDDEPGDTVEVELVRAGETATETVEVELIEAPDGSGRTIMGFNRFDTASVELPFELHIDTGTIGGPSAGLAFTLTLIDELSEGNLTGGADVAVTGTIGVEGQVGPIGGLAQKASVIRQLGIDTFIVPAGQSGASLAAAREVVGDEVDIVTVATLSEALEALVALGGDPVESFDD
ncbi:MAG: S16 family serine protease [Desertimonas sp.]